MELSERTKRIIRSQDWLTQGKTAGQPTHNLRFARGSAASGLRVVLLVLGPVPFEVPT
jgi:hypothetical protein